MLKIVLKFDVQNISIMGKEGIIDGNKVTIIDNIAYLKGDMSLVTGKVKESYKNGQLGYEATFKDGKMDGVNKSWYKDGQLKSEAAYKDGKMNGVNKFWNEDGQLAYEETWKDDNEDGVWLKWHKNGQLKSETTYKDGKLISKKDF